MVSRDPSSIKSMGEAHLYLAVAKADNQLSNLEKARAPYLAGKALNKINLLKKNADLAGRLKDDINYLFTEGKYSSWDADAHLEAGVRLLKEARKLGDYTVKLTAHKHLDQLKALALLDEYDFQESSFIKKMTLELNKLQ